MATEIRLGMEIELEGNTYVVSFIRHDSDWKGGRLDIMALTPENYKRHIEEDEFFRAAKNPALVREQQELIQRLVKEAREDQGEL